MTASAAAQQTPGKIEPPHAHRRHHPAKSHGKHHAHSGRTRHTASRHGNAEPVRRNETAKGAPLQAPGAQASHGYNPASEFTVTPHMMLNFGVGGRL
jgi:hypothetical protein